MTARNSNSARWTDEDVEQLLVDFYQRESPRELPALRVENTQQPAARVATATAAGAPHAQRAAAAGYASIAVVACVLLLVVTVLSPVRRGNPNNPTDINPIESVNNGPKSGSPVAIAPKPLDPATPLIIAVPDSPLRLPDTGPLPPELIPLWELPGSNAFDGLPPVAPPRTDWLDRLDIRVFPLPESRRKTPPESPRRLSEQQ